MTELLESTDKDFKAAMIKVLQWAIMNSLKRENIESLSKEIEYVKNQKEIL